MAEQGRERRKRKEKGKTPFCDPIIQGIQTIKMQRSETAAGQRAKRKVRRASSVEDRSRAMLGGCRRPTERVAVLSQPGREGQCSAVQLSTRQPCRPHRVEVWDRALFALLPFLPLKLQRSRTAQPRTTDCGLRTADRGPPALRVRTAVAAAGAWYKRFVFRAPYIS